MTTISKEDLQSMFNRVIATDATEINWERDANLLIEKLSTCGDAEAVILVWERLRDNKGTVSTAAKQAMARLECRSKPKKDKSGAAVLDGRPKTLLKFSPSNMDKRSLQPLRHIHKICKGSRSSTHNAACQEYVEAATEYIAREAVAGRIWKNRCGVLSARMELAHRFRREFGLNRPVAKALITSLKRRKVL